MDNISSTELKFALKVYMMNITKSFTLRHLLKNMDLSVTNPLYRKFLKTLIDNGCVKLREETENGYKVYVLDKKKLRQVIEAQEIYILCSKYYIYNIP